MSAQTCATDKHCMQSWCRHLVMVQALCAIEHRRPRAVMAIIIPCIAVVKLSDVLFIALKLLFTVCGTGHTDAFQMAESRIASRVTSCVATTWTAKCNGTYVGRKGMLTGMSMVSRWGRLARPGKGEDIHPDQPQWQAMLWLPCSAHYLPSAPRPLTTGPCAIPTVHPPPHPIRPPLGTASPSPTCSGS